MNQWKWSEQLQLWYQQHTIDTPPVAYCRGDRLIYWSDGVDIHSVDLCGSTPDNWHGMGFGFDLVAGLDWLKESNGTSCDLWLTQAL